MNREAVAVRRRRQEALDSLEFEEQRERALVERLEPLLRDVQAWRADELAFAAMDVEDRETLQRIGFAMKPLAPDGLARVEGMIGELEGQLADCRSRQRAFAAYAAALAARVEDA